jgi:hypothetical protein
MVNQQTKLKTYLASIGAVKLEPGIIINEQEPGLSVAQVDTTNTSGRFAVASAHCPRLLVKYEEAEAREDAFREARLLFPEEDGWTNHLVMLNEIPRSKFIEMQLFLTIREFYHRMLWLTGFKVK